MFTQCPGCHTLFRVSRRELAQADGRVRCGLCQEAFDASALLRDRLPPELDQILGLEMGERVRRTVISQATEGTPEPPPPPRLPHGEAPRPSRAEPPAAGIPPAIEPEPPAAALPEVLPLEKSPPPASGTPADDSAAGFREQAVLDVEGRLAGHHAQYFPWWGLAVALMLVALLGGQWLYFQRETLAREPGWRPVVATLCGLAGCRLPPVRRPQQLALLTRTLQTHPGRPGAMLLTASVVNRGPPQPWPQLGVTLRRMNGEVAARRWFAAAQYLDVRAPAHTAAQAMPAGKPYPVRLAFLDPGQGADNFELDFR